MIHVSMAVFLFGMGTLCGVAFAGLVNSLWYHDWRRGRRAERAGDYTKATGCSACEWVTNKKGETGYSFEVCPACGQDRAEVITRPIYIGRKIVRWERRGE